ncbi:ABC transporter permease [Actinokineospora iranica]|uniref:Transport permease protein n=1 Tax=Actinokineospora iranica TaxID=1271860 RepID=A0A1G6MDP4_9PSEU|nr:ABC transporter permease [Actinokineospora iranica]SDC53728.1 ABC-2 type transport system permease protein [Actinokineospora iranica]
MTTPRTHTWSDSMRAIAVVASRDLHRQTRHPAALAAQAAQIVFFVLVYAVGFDGMIGTVGSVPFSTFVFPGIVAIQIVTVGVSSGLTYAFDREFGALREMLVAPVPRLCLPLGKVAASAVSAGAQSAVLLLFAPLLRVPLTLSTFAAAVLGYTLTGAVFGLAGIALATVVPQVTTLQSVVQMAMYPLLFLSGSVFRPESGPSWLAWAVWANPMTYAVDGIRQVLIDAPGSVPLWVDAGVVGGLALALVWFLGRRIGGGDR